MMRMIVLVAGAAAAMATPARAEDMVSLDIYAIPSAPLVASVDRASAELAASGMQTFRMRGQAVHATLYLTRYPASAIPRLKKAVAALAKRRASIPLAVDGIDRTANNWLFLHLARTPALQRLADEATLAGEPLRDRSLAPPAWMSAYPAKLPAFERYGSPNVFMQFDPHLTLLANEANPALGTFASAPDMHRFDAAGSVVGIGIGEVDANGQIVRTVAEYRFKR